MFFLSSKLILCAKTWLEDGEFFEVSVRMQQEGKRTFLKTGESVQASFIWLQLKGKKEENAKMKEDRKQKKKKSKPILKNKLNNHETQQFLARQKTLVSLEAVLPL